MDVPCYGVSSYVKIYKVGGAVRDRILGLPVTEIDWVVVGATPEILLNLGYKQVGNAFPVFLHPDTAEEYALARKEMKTAPGYQGFAFAFTPEITLAEDLLRRDLTINAIAEDEKGKFIDPYGGIADIKKRLLRHVSKAFVEDPVRLLRVARFYAQFAHLGFSIATETMALMQEMVANDEVKALTAERVLKELRRALVSKSPEKFFEALQQCSALAIIFPDFVSLQSLQPLKKVRLASDNEAVLFAVLMHCVNQSHSVEKSVALIKHVNQQFCLPKPLLEQATLLAKHYDNFINATNLSAEALLTFLEQCDVIRRPERFALLLESCVGLSGKHKVSEYLQEAVNAIAQVDITGLLQQGLQGQNLAKALRAQRLQVLKTDFNCNKVKKED